MTDPTAKETRPEPDPGRRLSTRLGWAVSVFLALGWGAAVVFGAAGTGNGPGGPATAATLDRRLRAAVDDPAPAPWILFGDSVLAGASNPPALRTVAERMRALAAPDAAVSVHDLSWPGALPRDLDALVTRLDRLDPRGRVSVVVQMTPRYLSSAYRDGRGSLPDLESSGSAAGRLAMPDRVLSRRFGFGGMRAWLVAGVAGRAPWPGSRKADDAAIARAGAEEATYALRVRPHFLETVLDDSNKQWVAWRSLAARVVAHRRSVFFVSPIRRAFLAEEPQASAVDATQGALAGAVPDGALTTLLTLEDGSFDDTLFLDHCHLTPRGIDRLASRLLLAMGAVAYLGPRPEALPPTPAMVETVVGGSGTGQRDGSWHRVLFRAPTDMVVTTGGWVLVSDTGAGVVRRVWPDRHVADTFWRGPDDVGTQGAPPFRPGRMAADAEGGLWVADQASGRLFHLDSGAMARPVAPWDGVDPGRAVTALSSAGGRLMAWVQAGSESALWLKPDGSAPPLRLADQATRTVLDAAVTTEGDVWIAQEGGVVLFLPAARVQAVAAGAEPTLSLASLPPAATLDSGVAAQRWSELPRGTAEKPWPLAQAWMGPPRRVLAAPSLGPRSALFVDDTGTDRAAWWVDAGGDRTLPLGPPWPDGERFGGRPGPVGTGIPALDPARGDVYWLLPDRSWLVRWRPQALAPAWDSEARAEFSADASTLRVAVYGSSMEAGIHGESPSRRTSLAESMTRALSQRPDLAHRRTQVLSRCTRGNPLERTIAGLARDGGSPPHVAVVALDRRPLQNLAIDFPRVVIAADGLPAAADDPLLPVPLYEGEREALAAEQALSRTPAVLGEALGMLRLAAGRVGATVLLVDLLGIDEDSGAGIVSPADRLVPEGTVCRLARSLGLACVDVAPRMFAALPWRGPWNGIQDHHLRAGAMEELAERVAEALAPMLAVADPAVKGKAAATAVAAASWTCRPTPRELDNRFGIDPSRLAAFDRGDGFGIVVDLTPAGTAPGGTGDASPGLPAPGAAAPSWQAAAWAFLACSPPVPGSARAVEVSFILMADHNEYGAVAAASSRSVARYRFPVDGRPGAPGIAAAIAAGDNTVPAWVERLDP